MRSEQFQSVSPFQKRVSVACPFFVAPVSAGFPSPADDYVEQYLDLNECLVRHPAATFFARVKGSSMEGVGIYSGDTLIVDRSLEPRDNQIIIALLDGEFTVKRVRKQCGRLFLLPENPAFEAIEIEPSRQFEVWGVVTYVIHPV